MRYWLFKTEPDSFSIYDLENSTAQKENWDGIRNYQARNYLRDDTRVGDRVFIYHSSCKHIGIAGLAEITRINLVDPSQFDPESQYFDPKSTPENPRWVMVEVKHVETFKGILSTEKIKSMGSIEKLPLLRKGHRLSIMPVDEIEYSILLKAAHAV